MASTMEEEVYLTMQHVFSNQHAEMRHPKAIKHRIHAHRCPEIKALDSKYTRPVIVSTCQELLQKRIFESRWKAEQRFPRLSQGATPVITSEAPEPKKQEINWKETFRALTDEMQAQEMARQQSAVVGTVPEEGENMISAESHDNLAIGETGDAVDSITTASSSTVVGEHTAAATATATAIATAEQPPEKTTKLPRLRTAFLSYEAQHALMTRTQELLEEACFEFAKQEHPEILESGQWDSSECVELQKWIWIFNNELFSQLEGEKVPLPHTGWHTFFESIRHIRHKAVHRQVLCAADVKAYLTDAESLARLLRQDECLAKLGLLKEEMEMALAISERKRGVLVDLYQAKFDEIEARRKELDELEERMREEMVRDHRKMQSDLGYGFKLAIAEMRKTEAVGMDEREEEGAGSWGLVDGFWKLVSGRRFA
ncbi:ubiquinol-cytochrome-c reductase cytochrome c1 [Colletotrichum salicis]|uniref:Ubiquinol-cytochrome-c reductase cytochrome c1 n=1 Tax=Colletotrichum salicis TaxID=1209931 RepID=A0A135UPJ8_9PEZI|nr:ubiquinol-cytochrome-c reductase cytochrome c1 [Colletotrichum salicis]